MLWEGTLFLVEVLCTAALLMIAGGVSFKSAKTVSEKNGNTHPANEYYEFKKAA